MTNAHETLAIGQDLERQLDCRLFANLDLQSLLRLSIEELQRCHRREMEVILFVQRLLDTSTDANTLAEVLRTMGVHGKERPGSRQEILGYPVKAICSNIRRQDVDWNAYGLNETGTGTEGDIVLAQALTSTGSTNHLENQSGRDVRLFKGDYFMGVMGNRHSGTSEYGELPDTKQMQLGPDTQVDLLCYGGILGKGICIPNAKPVKTFFKARIAGILQNGERNLNLLDLFPDLEKELLKSAPIIFNCGTSAEIGKTTSSSSVIRALKRKGLRVGATKLTGTGRYRDLLSMRDAGADSYYDFPDVGLPSTYTTLERSYATAVTLFNKLNREKVDIIVAEMGGDIIEANIPAILRSPEVMQHAIGIVHSSSDVMGMLGSLQRYKEFGVQVPVKLTLPKDRNNAGTRNRLRNEKLAAFDVMIEGDCDQVVEDLLGDKKAERV